MAHDLSRNPNGEVEMMYVGEMPWHRLGTRLKVPPATAQEAIKAAHLDWRVEKKQLYIGDEGRPYVGEFAVVRQDRWESGDEGAVFGQVSGTYELLQNEEAFTFFDPIIQTGKAFYETAGALGKGQRVWVMVQLRTGVEIVHDDAVARYLLLTNTHDGTGSIQVKFTPVRVVCRNTLSQALKLGESLRVAHRTSLHANLVELSETVAKVLTHFERIEADFRRLANVSMTSERLTAYVASVFREPEKGKDLKRYERAKAQMERDRRESARLFEAGTGNDLPQARGTLWAAYNGIVEYADFRRNAARDKKWLESVWFGEAFDIKLRALDAAMKIANSGGRAVGASV